MMADNSTGGAGGVFRKKIPSDFDWSKARRIAGYLNSSNKHERENAYGILDKMLDDKIPWSLFMERLARPVGQENVEDWPPASSRPSEPAPRRDPPPQRRDPPPPRREGPPPPPPPPPGPSREQFAAMLEEIVARGVMSDSVRRAFSRLRSAAKGDLALANKQRILRAHAALPKG